MAKFAIDPTAIMTGVGMPLQTNEELAEALQDMGPRGGQASWGLHGPSTIRYRGGVDVSQLRNWEVSGDTDFADIPKGFARGTVDIVNSILGVIEMTGAVEPGTFTQYGDRAAKAITDSMSPSARKNLERQWTDMGPEGVARNPKAILNQLSTVAPSVLASLIPAFGAAKVASAAGKTEKAARAIGTATGVGSEALQIGGATYNEVRGVVDNMNHDELMQYSPHYAKAFKKHGDEAEARKEITLKASRSTAFTNAVWGAMVAAGPSYIASKVGAAGRGAGLTGTRKERFAKGFAIEGGEEVAQEVPGGILTGMAIQGAVDTRTDPYADITERAVQSFALGGGIGGPLGVLAGTSPQTQTKEVPPDIAAAVRATQLPLPLEDQFGEGQPGPQRPPTAPTGGPPGQLDLFGDEVTGAPAGVQGDLFGDPTAPREPFPDADTLTQMDAWPNGVPPTRSPAGIGPQGEYQTEMPFGPDRLPILPQDTSQTIVMPPGPGQQLEMQGLYDTGFTGPVDQNRPLMPPPAAHVPEPIEDIQAQVAQMLDPETYKQAVYIDPAAAGSQYEGELNELMQSVQELLSSPEVKENYPNFKAAVDPHGGLVLATEARLVNEYLSAGATEAARAKLLNYQQSKDQIVNPDKTFTISKVNPDGSVAESQVVDADGPAFDNAQLSYYSDLKPGQRVVVQPTGVALQQRAEQLELPLNKPTREGMGRANIPRWQRPKKQLTQQDERGRLREEERLEAALEKPRPRPTAFQEAVREEGRMEAEAKPFKEQPKPDTAKTIQLYKDFKKLFGTLFSGGGAQNVAARGQGDLLQGANEMFAGLSKQQARDIRKLLDEASATKRTGVADRATALQMIDEILGGTGDLQKIESFLARRLPTPGQQPEPEVEAEPAKKGKKPYQYKLRVSQKQPKKKSTRVPRTETEKYKQWKAQEILKYGAQQNTERKAHFDFRKRLLDAIQNLLVNTFGLTEEQAKAFELDERHLSRSLTMGKAARKDAEGKPVKSTFEREVALLQLAMQSDDDTAVLQFLERQGLDAIAKVLVAGRLKVREALAIKFVKRWRRDPNKVDFPADLKAKLRLIYDKDLEAALGATKAQLEQMFKEQQKELEQEGQAVSGVEVKGSTEMVLSEGAIKDLQVDYEQGDVYLEEEPTELVRTKRGESGKAQTSPPTSPPRREKTAVETEIDSIVRAAQAGGATPGTEPDGSGGDAGALGQLRVPEPVRVPDQGTPESVPAAVFERDYARLDQSQREGVSILWQAIKNSWDKGTGVILGDGTGVGKTTEMLVLAHLYIQEFTAKHGRPPRILTVTPNKDVYHQWAADARMHGLFKTHTVGNSDKIRSVIEGLENASNYNQIADFKGEEFDLVIYDEAHKIGRNNAWHKNHKLIKAKHTIYTTATPGDKETSLTLFAALEGKTLKEMLQDISPTVRIDDEGEAGEMIDITSVGDIRAFYQALADKITTLQNQYRYVVRRFKRIANITLREIEGRGKFSVTLSNGQKVNVGIAEDMLIRYWNRADEAIRSKFNINNLWMTSTKLAELAKLDEMQKIIAEARANGDQVVVLFGVQQQKKDTGPAVLGIDPETGKPVTLKVPIALREAEKILKRDYPGEVTVVAGNARIKPRVEGFQSGQFKILLGTYDKAGVGLNLDSNVSREEGGAGRTLILMTDPWGPDVLDQAIGRVDRKSTKIAANVIRLFSGYQGDIARAEKLQYKQELTDAISGNMQESVFTLDRNIKVRAMPGNEYVAIRINALPKKSKPFEAIQKLLKARSKSWSRATREWVLPVEEWDESLQGYISQILSAANGNLRAPVETEPEVAQPTPEAPAKPKKPTKKQAVEAATKADASPELDALSMAELQAMEEALLDKLDTTRGKEWEAVDSTLSDVYRAMERKATDMQSVSHANAGPFSNDQTNRIVRKAVEQGEPLHNIIRRMARSTSLPPHRRKLLQRMARHIKRTKLELVTEGDFAAMGYEGTAALYRGAQDTVYLRKESIDPEAVVHEALHAVMHHAIRNDYTVRKEVHRLMDAVKAQFMAGDEFLTWSEGEQEMFMQAMTDPDEFVSYGLTNDKVVAELMKTPDPRQESMLRRFLNTVLHFLGLRNRAENRTVLDSLEELVSKGMTSNRTADDLSLQLISGKLGEATTTGIQGLTNLVQGSNAPQDVNQWRAAVRRKVLGFTTLRQIEKVYQHVLDKLPVGNPVRKWIEAMHQKEVSQKAHATVGNEMHRAYAEAINQENGKHRKAIEQLIGESTLYEVWVNESLDSKKNKHLTEEGKAKYRELRKLYDSSPVVSKLYNKLLDYYAEEKKENFKLRIRNIVDSLEWAGSKVVYLRENGIEVKVSADDAYNIVAPSLLSDDVSYKPADFMAYDENGEIDTKVSELLASAIKENQATTLQNGPYFPLKRFGDWIVSAYRDEKTFTASLDAGELDAIRAAAEKKINKDRKTTRDKWAEKEMNLYASEVQAGKRRALRKKLSEQADKHWGGRKSVEREVPIFEGDSASMETRERWVSMHESEAKALRALEAVKGEGWQTEPNYVVSRKVSTGNRKISSNSALINHVRSKLGLNEREGHPVLAALEASVIDLLPETSVSKEQLNRKGIFGYDDDHGRALAAHVQSASWYRATLEHGKEISRAVSELTTAERDLSKNEAGYTQPEATEVGDVLREVRNHVNLEGNNDTLRPAVQAMGQIGFLWLLVSPAYIFVNLTQPMMFTLPWLRARQGDGMPAWRAFQNAYKAITPEIMQRAGLAVKQMGKWDIDPDLFDFLQRDDRTGEARLSGYLEKRLDDAAKKGHVSRKNLAELKTMLETLSKNNVLDFTLSLDTTAAAQGKSQQNWNTRTMDVARIIPHLSEVMNRAVTAIAAFEMAKSQGMNAEAATEFATEAVTETQFDYTLLNKPRFMSERYYALAKPIFMFMQHPQHVYALFVHTALTGGRYAKLKRNGTFDPSNPEHKALEQEWKARRDTVVGILSTHMLMGGMTAAMFEPTKWALGLALLVSEAISGEPPEETEVYIRRWMDDMFGEGMGEIMADGLPAALGLHLSDNLSISSLAIMNTPGKFSADRQGVQEATFSLLGPLPQLVANGAQGISDIKDGDTIGGLAKMMPRLVREPLKTYGMATSGLRDSNGNIIVDSSEFTPLELATATLGIRLRKVAGAYETKTRIDNVKNFHRLRRKRLTERLYRAQGDAAKLEKVYRDIDKYNASLPAGARPVPKTVSAGKLRSQKAMDEYGSVITENEKWMAEQ